MDCLLICLRIQDGSLGFTVEVVKLLGRMDATNHRRAEDIISAAKVISFLKLVLLGST